MQEVLGKSVQGAGCGEGKGTLQLTEHFQRRQPSG